ncbi:hypothetical protein LX64_04505 [Chitinophaga skermanii]|uniref:Uncharacterized protein n=2 Tax=Chitinophaga skermanii TaxID=331697 RepID=A0A327Q5X7_9BACT|nr:hypothetical protein LX64_04505 [Chitinophaga skermanii]
MLITLACFMLSVMPTVSTFAQDKKWQKSKTATWSGTKDGITYQYKLEKNGDLTWSTDGSKFTPVAENSWADKGGSWYKIADGKLLRSSDKGETWNHVSDNSWEGPGGVWYKFDNNWSLMESRP